MQTEHQFIFSDSRNLKEVNDSSVDLVVTSPPYPMIEMWDRQFSTFVPGLENMFEKNDHSGAFEAMHLELDRVWSELKRVVKQGALVCINIGDATRTIDGRFRLFANHARVQSKFFELGFDLLPLILWRKQTNAPNKFMGSGMLPPGAYTTLEHEYILIFRNGPKRAFLTEEEKLSRRESAYFWEERNNWFSDLWDFKGVRQASNSRGLRDRSAAYPFDLPFRLINMFSIFGDTVLDPFSGTGTTAMAAIAAGRNSLNCEIDSNFSKHFKDRLKQEVPVLSTHNSNRLENHLAFVEEYQKEKGKLKHLNKHYGFPVMTSQEQDLKLAFVKNVEEIKENLFIATFLEEKETGSYGTGEKILEEFEYNRHDSQLRLF